MDHEPHGDLLTTPIADCLRAEDAEAPDQVGTRVGIRQLLLEAPQIKSLTIGPPPALSAFYRILYALAARVTGLDEARKGPDEWNERRVDLLENGVDVDAVDAYFAKYPGRFEMFNSQRPFLQDPRLAEQCPKSSGVNKLALGRPAGNNPAWFGHHFDEAPEPLRSHEALLHLLMWLYYGPAGRCATRTVGHTSEANSAAGPLRSSISFHPEGVTLWETLLAGLTPPETTVRREQDLCPWETDELDDPVSAAKPYAGPLSRLTGGWQHALLLIPDNTGRLVTDAYITWGHRGKKPLTRDAYVIWQTSKEGNTYARPASSGRALWRDVDALLLKEPSGSTKPQRPEVFTAAEDLEGGEQFRVRALGFEQDGKTKDMQFVSGLTPPLLGLMQVHRPEAARQIGDLRVVGELYGHRLATAVKRAWAVIHDAKMADCIWSEQAAAHYWPRAEGEFWSRVRSENFTQSWRDFRRLAEESFDAVTEGLVRTAKGARAIEHARLDLYGGRRTKDVTGRVR
ncbi:type I-E CRISPR-associated protein Cse1/CasA [Streptomyces sp. NPDC050085]|uniref:type I-E CRISPR-associated protein Cse1/CasA n=1 Tax=Streptomyces sp. NPDC050085 TaxID=3365600 RepID=UPI0037AE0500